MRFYSPGWRDKLHGIKGAVMAAKWTMKKELQAARREADERDDTIGKLAHQALKYAKQEALAIAQGPLGTSRSFYQGRIKYEGCEGGSHYARAPVANKLVELLKAEGFDDARADNCYEMVSFSW